MRQRICTALVAFAAAVVTAGCGGGYSSVPVSGKVVLDGKPLPGATVAFQLLKDPNAPPSTGVTNEQGVYTLSLANGKGSGALVGEHRVSISALQGQPPSDPTNDNPKPRKDLVPSRYNAETSLKFEVPAGGTDKADFKLQTNTGS